MIQTVVKRDGRIVGFNEQKVMAAIRKAMLHTDKGEDERLLYQITDRIAQKGDGQMTVEEIQEIEQLVREKRLIFSSGETGAYRACSVFCRSKILSGEMKNFVYGEAQYNHDMRHFYDSYKHSGGPDWKKVAGFPPMLYPTHSTSMILSCLPGVYAKKVAAFGYRERQDLDIFGENGQNYWNNPFSNTSALLQLSNGGIARISENRRIGWHAPQSYISNFHTETASYEFSVMHHYYSTWDKTDPKKIILTEVSDLLNPPELQARINDPAMVQECGQGFGFVMTSPIHTSCPKLNVEAPKRNSWEICS